MLTMARLLRREWLWKQAPFPLRIWEFTPATARAMFRNAGFEMAAYGRSQPPASISIQFNGALRLITLPTLLLSLPGIDRRVGTGMEFPIRKPSR